MKKVGIVSYNIHCSFTNYGSALQSWALSESIKKIGYEPILIDYCPNSHLDSNPLNPLKKMWDQDEESKKNCKLSLPAIKENFYKFEDFYTNKFNRTKNVYNYKNFNDIIKDENVHSFVCGGDTIFCVDEFGIDEGYYANYECMKNKSISYSASFGDSHFNNELYKKINVRLQNFKAIGLRENTMVDYVKDHVNENVVVEKVLDPTLLLTSTDYDTICSPKIEEEKYLLLYTRRYNKKMEEYADKIAKENGWKVIEISLRATNSYKHKMFYEAGVEEFLSLIKNAEFVVTNSFHGLIFSVQYKKQFVVFSREQANVKISELIDLFGLHDRVLITGEEKYNEKINYEEVENRINKAKEKSIKYLNEALQKI